jgi:type IV pilus assembly protein PilN
MIQINLLPHREARRAADLRETVAVLVLGLVVIGGVVVFVGGGIGDEIIAARATVQQLEGDIARYKPQEAQVEVFKKKKSQLEDKLDVIKGLDRARSGPVRIMDELATHTPERLWLTSMTTKSGAIQIEGNSLDNGVVADFLRGLSSSAYFANVDLVKTGGGDTVDGVRLVKFVISADLVTPEVEDGPVAGQTGA